MFYKEVAVRTVERKGDESRALAASNAGYYKPNPRSLNVLSDTKELSVSYGEVGADLIRREAKAAVYYSVVPRSFRAIRDYQSHCLVGGVSGFRRVEVPDPMQLESKDLTI